MSIFQRKKTKTTPVSEIAPDYLAELMRLPYAEDFDLPDQAMKLAKIYEHTLSGGSFEVRKVMGGRTGYSPIVAVFDEFPSEPQILDAIYERYGGGGYSVHLQGRPGSIKSFNFPGRSTFHADGVPRKTVRQELGKN